MKRKSYAAEDKTTQQDVVMKSPESEKYHDHPFQTGKEDDSMNADEPVCSIAFEVPEVDTGAK